MKHIDKILDSLKCDNYAISFISPPDDSENVIDEQTDETAMFGLTTSIYLNNKLQTLESHHKTLKEAKKQAQQNVKDLGISDHTLINIVVAEEPKKKRKRKQCQPVSP